MNNIGALILIQISLSVLWETTSITLKRMGAFESNYMIVFLMILSAFAFGYLETYLNKIQR